jgi:hypothetical protein
LTTIETTPDGLGGQFVHAGPARQGRVFPAVTSGFPHYLPADRCVWFGRRTHGKARPFPNRDAAHAYVAAAHTLEETS